MRVFFTEEALGKVMAVKWHCLKGSSSSRVRWHPRAQLQLPHSRRRHAAAQRATESDGSSSPPPNLPLPAGRPAGRLPHGPGAGLLSQGLQQGVQSFSVYGGPLPSETVETLLLTGEI